MLSALTPLRAQRPAGGDSAQYFGLLPQVSDLPAGSQLVTQMTRGGSTFVRVYKISEELAVNSAVRVFERPDSSAAYFARMVLPPSDFARAAGSGFTSRGLVPDSVLADTLHFGGTSAQYVSAVIARYFLPSGVFVMTQAMVGTTDQMVLYQAGGAAPERDVIRLLRTLVAFSDSRMSRMNRRPLNDEL